jgi:hypothetical protein
MLQRRELVFARSGLVTAVCTVPGLGDEVGDLRDQSLQGRRPLAPRPSILSKMYGLGIGLWS